MKIKWIIFTVIASITIVYGVCFAYDTEIGNIKLTANQLQHLSEINGSLGGKVKGACYWDDGRVIVTSEIELTKQDKEDLMNIIGNFADVEIPKVKTVEDRITELEGKTQLLESIIPVGTLENK